jgi:1-acyl-sn-glycerol-3-phosphate acyltransferase
MTYRLLRLFFAAYLRLCHGLRIEGREEIPPNGPLILCANHASYFDAMLVALCVDRPVRFLIIDRFYGHPLLGPVIRRCGAIPVSQRGNDRHALRLGLALLAEEGVLGVFPEGRLSADGRPGQAQPGAALLAVASGAPLVPISITGAACVFPKGRRLPRPGAITVRIHQPLWAPAGTGTDRPSLRALTDQVMARIAAGFVA